MGRRVAQSSDQLSNLARLKMGKQIVTDNFVNALNQGLDQKIVDLRSESEVVTNKTIDSSETISMQI